MAEHPFRPITITAWRASALAIANQKAHSPKTVRRLALRMINALDRIAVLEVMLAEAAEIVYDNGYGEWPAELKRHPPTQADRLAALGRHPSNSPFAMQRT